MLRHADRKNAISERRGSRSPRHLREFGADKNSVHQPKAMTYKSTLAAWALLGGTAIAATAQLLPDKAPQGFRTPETLSTSRQAHGHGHGHGHAEEHITLNRKQAASSAHARAIGESVSVAVEVSIEENAEARASSRASSRSTSLSR